MKVTELAKAIGEQIRDNADVLALCREKFGKNHTIAIDVTGKESLREDQAPLFTVVAQGKSRGEEADHRLFDLEVTAIIKSTNTEQVNTVNGVTTIEHEGTEILENLLDFIMNDLRNISTELTFTQKGQSFETVEFDPLFVGVLSLTVSYPVLIGGYEPTI